MQSVSLIRLFLFGVVRSFTISLGVFALLMLMVVPAFAQDATPTPVIIVDPPPEEVPDEIVPVDLREVGDTLGVTFVETMWKTLQSAGLIVFITTLVGVIKYVPFVKTWIAEERISVSLLVFAVALVTWLVAGTATWFGFSDQFTGAVAWVVDVLPKSLQFLLLISGAPWLHEWASNHNVPVLGKKIDKASSEPTTGYAHSASSWQNPDGTVTRVETVRPGLYTYEQVQLLKAEAVEQFKLQNASG